VTSAVVALTIGTAACGGAIEIKAPQHPASADESKQLWMDPGSEARDLFWGIGGKKYAPDPDAVYKFKTRDNTGFSTKYDVEGPGDVEWSAKIGPEAQTEVLMSRILWGLGYHQQPIYYLPSWTLQRDGTKST